MLPFCSNCGASIQPNQNFCPVCGQRLTPTPYMGQAQQPPQPVYQQPPQQYYQQPPAQPMYQQPPTQPMYQQPPFQSGERVISVLPTMKKMKFLGQWDLYALIATERRAIFCNITKDMLNQALKEAQQRAKAEGKGFWGQWGAQLNTSFFFTQRYRQMSPEQALREQPGNFAIDHSEITKVNVWRKTDSGQKGIVKTVHWEVEFESRRGKEKYRIENIDPESELSAAFGSKINRPFF